MTRDDIIRVAREFGWAQKDIDSLLYVVETAAAAEREACAKVCERIAADNYGELSGRTIPEACARAIRARGET
jgi:hypothetical protein